MASGQNLARLLDTFPAVRFAFAYGSGVFAQPGLYQRRGGRLLDFIFAVDSPIDWHAQAGAHRAHSAPACREQPLMHPRRRTSSGTGTTTPAWPRWGPAQCALLAQPPCPQLLPALVSQPRHRQHWRVSPAAERVQVVGNAEHVGAGVHFNTGAVWGKSVRPALPLPCPGPALLLLWCCGQHHWLHQSTRRVTRCQPACRGSSME